MTTIDRINRRRVEPGSGWCGQGSVWHEEILIDSERANLAVQRMYADGDAPGVPGNNRLLVLPKSYSRTCPGR